MSRRFFVFIFSGLSACVCMAVLGYWLEVLIAVSVAIILGIFFGYYSERDGRTMQNIRGSKFTSRNPTKDKDQKIRDTVEKEWDRQTVFDNAEDLK